MILRSRRSWKWKTLLLSALMMSSLAMAGGAPRRVSGSHEGNCFTPIISPDGKQVAYEVNYYERRVIELYIQNLETGRETQVQAMQSSSGLLGEFGVGGGENQVTYELAWSPLRPGMYVFASSGGDENFDIYLAGGSSLAADPAADGMASWSSDGQLVAFTSSRTGEGDLYLIDINKTENEPARLTDNSQATEWYPTWSHIGRRLLFVSHHSKGGDNLFLINDISAKDSAVQLTNWPSVQTKPSWSPDDKQIAFYSNRSVKDRYDLYVMKPVPGGQPKKIMRGVLPNDRLGPTWAPGSKALLVVKDDPEHFNPIRLVSVDDPTKVKVVSTGTQNNGDTYIVTTPEGKTWLAFTAQGKVEDNRKAFKQAYTYPLDTNDLAIP